jgi:hypothetical protein
MEAAYRSLRAHHRNARLPETNHVSPVPLDRNQAEHHALTHALRIPRYADIEYVWVFRDERLSQEFCFTRNAGFRLDFHGARGSARETSHWMKVPDVDDPAAEI